MIIIVDIETKKPVEFNDKVYKLLGYSREEFFKMGIYKYDANENQEEVNSHVEQILRDGGADFETKFLTKKGEILDIFARVRVIELLGKKYFQSICQDITERKKAEKELKRIEWLLKAKPIQYQIETPEYGDLTELNEQNMILKKVGKEVLNDIVIDFLNLLETSAAVYEKNGDYALGILSSGWCTFLDNTSRKLCNIEDNIKALNCGKWICHESCWSKASKKSIELGKSVETECDGGLHIFATPILANNEIVGSISIGYGDPPSDEIKLQEIAEKYDIKLDKLKELSNSYESRPVWMINIAKNKLLTSAKLIGEIIERKMIEQKLRESELMLQKSQEIAQIGSFEMDLSTNEVVWSNQLYKLFGLKKEAKIVDYEKVLALIHPDDRERAIKVSSEATKEQKPYKLEHRVIHPDGRILNLLITGDVIRNDKNEIVKIGGITQDITENKKKEEELRLHSAIMLNVNEGIHLVRLNDGMIVYANPAFEKMLGYNPGEMIGKDVAIVNAPTDKTPKETKEEIMGILAETREWHGEVKNIKKDGTPFWCYANVSKFDHPEYGKVLVSVHTDITERKITEQKLKESEKKYHDLYEDAPIAYFSIGTDKEITNCNKAAHRLLGYTKEELANLTVFDLYADNENGLKKAKNLFKHFLKGEIIQDEELQMKRKNGESIWVNLTVDSIKDQIGNIIESRSIVIDITERKKAEQSLLKSQKNLSIKNKISNIFLTFPDEEMYGEILALVLKELKSKFGVFGYINENGDLVEPSLTREVWDKCKIENKSIIFKKKNWAQNIYGKIIKEKRSIYMNKSFKVPNGHLPILNFLGTPIIHQNEIIGIITIANKESDYNENDITLIESIIDDITPILHVRLERDLIEKQRKKTEKKISDLAKFPSENPNPVLRVKKDRVIYANQAGQQLFGIRESSIVPIILQDIVNEVILTKTQRLKNLILNNRIYSLVITPIENENYANIYGRDITLREKAERELKKSEVKLRERVKELKCLYGISKLIEKSNISLEQIINGTLKLIPPAWQYPNICNAKITYNEKKYTTLNFEESEWKLCSDDKINDKDLKIEVFYLENKLFLKEEELLIRDIGDRLKSILELKEAELELKTLNQELESRVEERTLDLIKSEEKVKNLINNISDVLIEIDNQGVLIFISPQIIRISEYQSKEVTGTILLDQIHFKDRELYQEFFKKAINTKDAISIECRLKHKKGYYVPISIRGSYVKIKNKNNFYGVIRDITEKRKVDTMISREIKKLKELDRIKTDLITRMSHELKTPLISIFSGSEFLLNDYNDKLNDVVKNILSDIHAGGVRLKSMVENLLTVFEIDSKTINFRFSKENLIPIIKQCVEDVIFQANKRNILIDVELSEKIYFDVDKLMIERAISNIISNAIKNTPPKGNVFIGTIEHHNYIEIIIKDTGVGITKKELMDLFKPFGKIERYGKGLDVDIEGPGLGLYIANEIIKFHGGELILKCKGRNRGCTFTIRLNRVRDNPTSI